MDTLQGYIQGSRQERLYDIYRKTRQRVLAWLEERAARQALPSEYWQEELAGFDYLLDASPLIINKWREHCYHITGIRSNEYRRHHAHRQPAFARKLERLRRLDQHGLFVPESPELGGFGQSIDGQLVNLDTLKFYECLLAMDQAGLLDALDQPAQRPVILEIGGGWGGLAYCIKKLFPQVTYVIADLPQTLLVSAVYLQGAFPDASVGWYGDFQQLPRGGDFVFLPHYALDAVSLPDLSFAINTVSFQEMTGEQVSAYGAYLARQQCRFIYSLNRERSAHNPQLDSVSKRLSPYYALREVRVLDIPYLILPDQQQAGWRSKASGWLSRLRPGYAQRAAVENYRHLVGTLK